MAKQSELSMDARVLVSCFFGFGPKTSLKIGGKGAKSVLSDRAAVAMKELIAGGYVTASEFNQYGKMEYVGTDKCQAAKLSMAAMEEHGRWSATMPNPETVAA